MQISPFSTGAYPKWQHLLAWNDEHSPDQNYTFFVSFIRKLTLCYGSDSSSLFGSVIFRRLRILFSFSLLLEKNAQV